MLPTESLQDAFLFLSRDELDAVQLVCSFFKSAVAKMPVDSPLRHIEWLYLKKRNVDGDDSDGLVQLELVREDRDLGKNNRVIESTEIARFVRNFTSLGYARVHRGNSRDSRKRNSTVASLQSPAKSLIPPAQVYTQVQSALEAAQQFTNANASDPGVHVINLLCGVVTLLLQTANSPAVSDTAPSAHELERKRSIVISGLPEAHSDTLSAARDTHEKDSVHALVDLCRPPPPPVGPPPIGDPREPPPPKLLPPPERAVLSASRHLRNDPQYADVYVRPSLTKEQRDAEFKLREECRRLRAQGQWCSIRNGAVVTGN